MSLGRGESVEDTRKTCAEPSIVERLIGTVHRMHGGGSPTGREVPGSLDASGASPARGGGAECTEVETSVDIAPGSLESLHKSVTEPRRQLNWS